MPGTATAALTRGFGAVCTDVDLGTSTSLPFFDGNGLSLGAFFAPGLLGSQTFSFLGVSFADAVVSRVRITSGNAALCAGVTDQNGNTRDLVVMDDFLYGEPTAAAVVPEPATLLLTGGGLALLALASRRRAR